MERNKKHIQLLNVMKERHKNVPAAYLILIKNNKILLLRRYNTGYEDGNYSFIAGHVDPGETFAQAIAREAFEEAGINIDPHELELAHIMHRKSDDYERVDAFFTAHNWKGEVINKEPHKCDDLSWFDIQALPKNIIPYIRKVIDCVQKNRSYSEYGW